MDSQGLQQPWARISERFQRNRVPAQQDEQPQVQPTLTQTFSLYGITAFDVQYWNGSAWTTVSGGSVMGNNKVWRQFTFSSITTSKIRLVVNDGADHILSRVVEVEAWTAPSGYTSANMEWVVTDQVGTPSMIFDKTGSLAAMKRHDYLPFGEEISAFGGRTQAQGYNVPDNTRQQFTRKERDIETFHSWKRRCRKQALPYGEIATRSH